MNWMLSVWSMARAPLDRATARCSKRILKLPVRVIQALTSCMTPGIVAGLPLYLIGSPYLSLGIG